MMIWLRKRKLRSGLQMALCDMQAPPESGSTTLVSRTAQKDRAELWPVHLMFMLPGKRQKNRSTSFFRITGKWNGLSRWVKDLEGGWLENWWQGGLRIRYVDISLWGKKIWGSLSPVKIHQRMTSAPKDFNNQVARIFLLWMPVSHIPGHSCHYIMG